MDYRRAQMALKLFQHSRVAYHLYAAVSAAHEARDARRDDILALMTDEERVIAREMTGEKN